MKLNETEAQLRAARLKHIDTRWEQLNRLSDAAAERAIKYLMLTNAGGAVAMLSYFGANSAARGLIAPKLALGFFGFGILSVGVLNSLMLHHIERIFVHWRTASQQYLESKLDWQVLDAEDDRLSYKVWPEYIAGYTSFGCLVAGAIAGLCSLLFP